MTTFDLALLILRLAVGLTFAAHGAQKAFGWWQGPGPARWISAVHGMGFHPPVLFAAASILNEVAAGLALALGFATPLAVAILVAQSIVIVFLAHWSHGFFSTRGGIEFPMVLGVAAIAIGLLGPGALSLDRFLGIGFDPREIAILELAGIAAGCLALAVPRLTAVAARRPPRRAH